ncbi:MAG: hypothetical protein EOP56_04290 [Sphingobacteriales bacterium]|nr:MAG: hypothetical protein EOP56_04290 [Sphingobacteriales bacterium]
MSTYAVNSERAIVQQQIDAEQFLYMTTELFSVIVFIYDTEQKKLQYSFSQLHTMLRYDANTLPNADLFDIMDIFHAEDVHVFNQLIESCDESARIAKDAVCRLRNSDGSYQKFLLKARHVNKGGKKLLVIPATKAETLAMYPKQDEVLRTTINDLKEANRELEDFAYVASHDLQEPLRKITTFSSRLTEKCKDTLNDEAKMYLERIVVSANNMRHFIDSLLDFSRVSRSDSPFSKIDLNFILKQVRSELELTIEETKCEIQVSDLPTVDGSATQLKQLLTNLISNGIKFRKQDVAPVISINASVATEQELKANKLDANAQYCKIEVRDNGIGFDQEYAGRIFQMFQRLHGKSEYPGSGIGLAICKKIAEYHDGTIYAESAPGNGASFTILLPKC